MESSQVKEFHAQWDDEPLPIWRLELRVWRLELTETPNFKLPTPNSKCRLFLGTVHEKGRSGMTLELHATPEEVMRAVEALEQFCQERGVPEKLIFGLALGLEECGSNIVNHALQKDKNKTFVVRMDHTPNTFVIELRDDGPAFDPTVAAARVPSAEDDEREPGGWGIQLVRRYIDEISYTREAGQNVLRLTKRWAGADER